MTGILEREMIKDTILRAGSGMLRTECAAPGLFSMNNAVTQEEVQGGYYSKLKPAGGLSHSEGIEGVVDRVAHWFSGREHAQEVVRAAFDETMGPEYVKPAAYNLIAQAIMNGGDVYLWTVGDHGEGSDYYQQRKIDASMLEHSLRYILLKNGFDPQLVDTKLHQNSRFHVEISADAKHENLARIFAKIQEKGDTEVFVVDDKDENVRRAREVAQEFPGILYHEWVVKDDADTQGNLAAFRDAMIPHMSQFGQEKRQFALVLDWDETLTHERARMENVRRTIAKNAGKPKQEISLQQKKVQVLA